MTPSGSCPDLQVIRSIVYNRTKGKTKELADQGAQVADSPKAVAAGADVIISMISDNPALEAVSIGPEGAFETAKSGTIYIDMSTVSPVVSAGPGIGEYRPCCCRNPHHFCFRPQGRL